MTSSQVRSGSVPAVLGGWCPSLLTRNAADRLRLYWPLQPERDSPKVFRWSRNRVHGPVGASDTSHLGSFGGRQRSAGSTTCGTARGARSSPARPTSTPCTASSSTGATSGLPRWSPSIAAAGRFGSRDPQSDIPPAGAPWNGTCVLYLKHASDPIVWWSPRLILTAPTGSGSHGRRRRQRCRWIPFVTFWQVTADLRSPPAFRQGTATSTRGSTSTHGPSAPAARLDRRPTARLRQIIAPGG